MSPWIHGFPRWLMLGALIYAPWAYGSTRDWSITGMNWILGVCLATWSLECLLSRRWPRLPMVMAGAALTLVAQAWFMVWNAKFDYLRANAEFIPLEPLLPWAPGSLHRSLSLDAATQLSLMLGAGLLLAEMVRSPDWRRRVLGTMAATGCSIALLGLAQRLTNADGIFWHKEDIGPFYFATFRNHTNAGAFLNLIWPLTLAGALRSYLKGESPRRVAAWSAATGISLTAMLVNTSRAATLIAAVLAMVAAAWVARRFFRERLTLRNVAMAGVAAVLVLGALASLTFMAGTEANAGRWRQFRQQLNEENPRLLAAQVCLTMIPEAGWGGFGPGTFQTAFPYFTADYGDKLRGRWIFAHQDYLQTVTEWGYAGTALWTVLFLGAGVHAWRTLRRRGRQGGVSDSARATHFAALVALAGVFVHALGDFPLQIVSIQLYVMALTALLWTAEEWMRAGSSMARRRSSLAHLSDERSPECSRLHGRVSKAAFGADKAA